jgi:Tol biopolymer transport system component
MAAMAAAAAVPARRAPRLVTVVVVILLLILLAAAVFAAVRYFLVGGTLRFTSTRHAEPGVEGGAFSHFLSEGDEWMTSEGLAFDADFSPDGSEVAYSIRRGDPTDWGHIVVEKTDRSEIVDLSGKAGMHGVNCAPNWSPDGRMISFMHFDPAPGQRPCDAGGHLWVMDADGSNAHRVMPEGSHPSGEAQWSPDGSRLMTVVDEVGTVITDIWGEHVEILPYVGMDASWSPDGSMIVSNHSHPDEVGGRTGHWRRLHLTDGKGNHPKVLVEQFVADEDLESSYPGEASGRSLEEWLGDGSYRVGPREAIFSPFSDKVAFLAAMPYDPTGPHYNSQIEVWLYDLKTDGITRLTDDDMEQSSLIWRAEATDPRGLEWEEPAHPR